MIKKSIKQFLWKKRLYHHLKYSWLFECYQRLFKPGKLRELRREKEFYHSFLPPCELIFDIGANEGEKTQVFLGIAKKVICCDPDELNYHILNVRFRNFRKRVCIEKKAVADKTGSSVMHLHHPGSAFNTLSTKWKSMLEADNKQRWNEPVGFKHEQTVLTTTLDNLIEQYGIPQFIKIDTEGYEETVLLGLSHPIPYISFETILPDYATELSNCLARIELISKEVTYNLALEERLLLPNFVNKTDLMKWLHANPITQGFEVIAKCR